MAANNENGISAKLERKAAISHAAPERHTTLQRVAATLSRRNADGAIVELFAEACQRVTQLAYERDQDGFCNIDPVTCRLLIPAPWGKAGHRKWGITASESVILREMIQCRQTDKEGRGPGLWLYDRTRRAWRLNVFDYDRPEDGQRYWQRWPLGVREYRDARSKRVV